MPDLARRLAVARGDERADLVFRGGRVLSVFTREWLETDVAIVDGFVAGLGDYDGTEIVDVSGRYVVPGFIDAHMHLESTKLLPDEFARLVLPLGTTAVVADPHEIANVLGSDGVHWLLDFCDDLPLDVYFMAPSCVPASSFESPRRALNDGDLESLLRRRRVLGLAEMMNFPGVIAGDDRELSQLRLRGAEHVDGHAPGVIGKELRTRRGGDRSDHGCSRSEGANGSGCVWLLIREASMARNLEALVPLIRELGPARIAFCRRPRPDDIVDDGHINGMLRRGRLGVEPADASCVRRSTRRAGTGCVTRASAGLPGRPARPARPRVLRAEPVPGRPQDRRDRAARRPSPAVGGSRRLARQLRGCKRRRTIRVSGRARPGGHRSRSSTGRPSSGFAVADPARDLAKIAVVERHLATGRVGLGFVGSSGLRRGALASTVAHDAHNVVVLGVSDDDMLAAVQRVVELSGGIVAVDGGRIVAECPLPVAGLFSVATLDDVIAQSRACTDAAKALGWSGATPFLTMAFLALSVIPALKITDRGLVDVERFELVPLETQ